ncbi:MAG: 30S ribosomal protein S9 [Verrucomicrobiia bacterium]
MSEKIQATGRRKTAVASVTLSEGRGEIQVNGRDFEDYFCTSSMREQVLASLTAVEAHKTFNVAIKATGGGLSGQAVAARHALARALLKVNPEYRAKLKELGYLKRDPRMRERKKPGQPGARKRFQFSKR